LNILTYDTPGRIAREKSIFHYLEGESYDSFIVSDFKPLFLEDILANMTDTEKADLVATCQSLTNKECIFDYYITGQSCLISPCHTSLVLLCFQLNDAFWAM